MPPHGSRKQLGKGKSAIKVATCQQRRATNLGIIPTCRGIGGPEGKASAGIAHVERIGAGGVRAV